MNLQVKQSGALQGELTVPADKSITHRAVLLGALSSGDTHIQNYLDSADCRASIACIRALGIRVSHRSGERVIHGRGIRGWREPADVLDCARSGTTMRLISGLLVGQPFMSVLSGRAQLRSRPMARIIAPLQQMGAQVRGRSNDRLPPLCIAGSPLHGMVYHSPVASAQVSSCILLAGLYAQGETVVSEPQRSRDHTARMLRARGVPVSGTGNIQRIMGPAESLAALNVQVPGDISSAAFFIVAGSIVPGSRLLLTSVGVNPTRTGIIDALHMMGADITLHNERDAGGEPVADIEVGYKTLRAAEMGGALIPRMIDEIPVLALAATQAIGVTVIREAAELRVKETDRIESIVSSLRALGARIESTADGLVIEGPTPLRGALVDSHADHRIAMTAAVAGLVAQGSTEITHLERIQDSFPGFVPTLAALAPEAVL